MMLFEYMIGNTDVSIMGLHNIRLVETPTGALYPVPYDFDSSGVVNAPYARPGPRLQLRSVRDRAYRGPCRTVGEFEEFFARFRDRRPAIMSVYDSVPNLKPVYVGQARAYLDEFFRTIARPESITKAFIERCDSRQGM